MIWVSKITVFQGAFYAQKKRHKIPTFVFGVDPQPADFSWGEKTCNQCTSNTESAHNRVYNMARTSGISNLWEWYPGWQWGRISGTMPDARRPNNAHLVSSPMYGGRYPPASFKRGNHDAISCALLVLWGHPGKPPAIVLRRFPPQAWEMHLVLLMSYY